MTVKHDCSGKIWGTYRDVSGRVYKCHRPATVQRDGKWYCWQHDPEYVAKRATERRAAWEAKGDREAAKYKRIARNARLGALVMPELPALLGRLANCTLPSEHGNAPDVRQCLKDRKAARTLAASIREALAQEVNDA